MKLKKIILPLVVITSLLGQTIIAAEEEVVLPVISKPAILNEGTQRELTPTQIGELLPWAKDSKQFLIDALDNLENLPASLQAERLLDSIKQVVQDSGPKSSELFMRYVLNRGLVISEILKKEMDADATGTVDTQLRVLKQSVVMAIKYYEIDLSILNKKSQAPYKVFGVEYFNFLTHLNHSIFDASAQYNIHRTALEFLQWDLYRDLNNKSFAPQIIKINNSLKFYPTKKMRDAESIALIRQMKKVTIGLNLGIKNEDKSEQTDSDQTQVQSETKEQESVKFDKNSPIEEIKIGSIVIVRGYKGKVVASRGDGIVVIEYITASGSTIIDPKELGSTKGCVNGFCVGEGVIDSTGHLVLVTGIKRDGTVSVLKNDWAYSLDRETNLLGKIDICNKNKFCAGETVIDSSGYTVKITGVRENGNLFIRKSDWSNSVVREDSSLARIKGCADRNICTGDTVYLDGYKVLVTGIKSATEVYVFKSDWAYSLLKDTKFLGTTK